MLTLKKAARLLASSQTNIVKCQLAAFEASILEKKTARLLVSLKANIVKCQLATFEASILAQINSLSPFQRAEMLFYKEFAEFKVEFCDELQETTIATLERAGWRVKTEPENNRVISVVVPMADHWRFPL